MIFSGRRRFQGDVRVDVRYRIGRRLTWPITARPQSPTRDLSASAMALTLTPAREKGVGRGADCSDILSQKGSRAGRRPRSGAKPGRILKYHPKARGLRRRTAAFGWSRGYVSRDGRAFSVGHHAFHAPERTTGLEAFEEARLRARREWPETVGTAAREPTADMVIARGEGSSPCGGASGVPNPRDAWRGECRSRTLGFARRCVPWTGARCELWWRQSSSKFVMNDLLAPDDSLTKRSFVCFSRREENRNRKLIGIELGTRAFVDYYG